MKIEKFRIGNIVKNGLEVKLVLESTQHPMHHQLCFVTWYDLQSQKIDSGGG